MKVGKKALARRKRITERRLVDVLVEYYSPGNSTWREVKLYEKRIDLVLSSSTGRELWAIEAKVDAWRRAFGQALINQVAADKSYIALWNNRIGSVDLDLLTKWGVGLIAVGTSWGDVEVILKARRSTVVNRYLKSDIVQKLFRS